MFRITFVFDVGQRLLGREERVVRRRVQDRAKAFRRISQVRWGGLRTTRRGRTTFYPGTRLLRAVVEEVQ